MGIGEQFELEKTGRIDPEQKSYCQHEREVEARTEKYNAEVRAVILRHLVAMGEEFRGFCQTTHGSGFYHGCNLTAVCNALEECGKRPDPYTISEFCQRIGGFVKLIESEANEKGPI